MNSHLIQSPSNVQKWILSVLFYHSDELFISLYYHPLILEIRQRNEPFLEGPTCIERLTHPPRFHLPNIHTSRQGVAVRRVEHHRQDIIADMDFFFFFGWEQIWACLNPELVWYSIRIQLNCKAEGNPTVRSIIWQYIARLSRTNIHFLLLILHHLVALFLPFGLVNKLQLQGQPSGWVSCSHFAQVRSLTGSLS